MDTAGLPDPPRDPPWRCGLAHCRGGEHCRCADCHDSPPGSDTFADLSDWPIVGTPRQIPRNAA